MCSYKKSVFTNILLEEMINIAIDTIFENYPNIKFTRKELQKLFKIATSETHLTRIGAKGERIDTSSI